MGWAIALFFLSLTPVEDLPARSLMEFDKLLHFGAYFLLVLLMYFGLNKLPLTSWLRTSTVLKIFLLGAIYGFSLEILQEQLTHDRSFDWFDALANVLGCSGIFLFSYLYPITSFIKS